MALSYLRLIVLVPIISAAYPSLTRAAELSGRVVAIDDGDAVSQAMVSLTLPKGAAGPAAITVFTAADGAFRLSAPSLKNFSGAALSVRKLGFRQVRPAAGTLDAKSAKTAGRFETRVYLQAVANIADDVPPSAWLADAPAGEAKNITVLSCSQCHQLPFARMREYAEKIEAVSAGPQRDRKAREEWRKVARHSAWRDVVKDMRAKHYVFFPLESAIGRANVDWATTQNADYNLFNARHGDIAADYLAQHFPRTTAVLPRDDYDYGAPLGVTERTVIREFALAPDSVVREMVPLSLGGKPYLWGTDVRRNLVVRIDPASGHTRWIPVDFKDTTGPHTIVPDDDGKLWVSMVDNAQFGRLDPATEKWTLWTLRPPGLPDSEWIGGAAIVHDMAVDTRGHLERDTAGRIWVTLSGTNKMGTLDPKTGDVTFHEANPIEGMSPTNTLIYSTILSRDRKHVWYSQLNGSVGSMNAESKQVEKLIPFPEGTGPRRMWRDDANNLWVALNGTGQVAKIDMDKGELVATYDLPDRLAAPYAVTWDSARKALWVATSNAEALYRLDPESGRFKVYPLPRHGAYLRMIAVDAKTGQLVGTYANYVPTGAAPRMGLLIDVGD
ncbi:MAG: SMP-30/gluconolactonase/LRE family protein [Rhodocyclaceae bacterium]|nr:SMP-30/gluconolactonase/LRE family protein [Rhodocyclaceae bacterium]